MQEEVIRRYGRSPRHAYIDEEQRHERDSERQALPAMRQPESEERTEIDEDEAECRDQRAPGLKREDGEGPVSPPDRDQIAAKHIALREAGVLYDLAQLHVIEHFHAQGLIGSDC